MVHDPISSTKDAGAFADVRVLSLIFEHTSDAVALLRVEPGEVYRVLLANESLFRMSGLDRAQVMNAPLEQFVPTHNAPIIRSRCREAIASRRTVVYDGAALLPAGPRYGENTLVPVFQGDGPVTHILAVIKDITARKLAELERERLLTNATFLSDATRLLASLDIERALVDVAHLSARYLGEYCAVDLLDERGPRRLVTSSREPDRARPASVHPTVLGGSALVYQEGDASYLGVPLRIDGRTVGAMTFATAERRYARADFEVAEELARRASLAVDNAGLYRQAQEALRARDEFLSLAAHEIRGPITSIHLGVQALLQRRIPPEGLGSTLELIQREDHKLTRFVDELVLVGAIRAGRLRYELEDVDLAEIVARVSRRLACELELSGSTLTVSAPARVVGRWDGARLEQVVMNLLSNAIKFGGGKPIEVALSTREGRARLMVRDRGIGIDPKARENLFEPFARAVSARHYGGLGLGLHIVKAIVDALGGSVAVESEVQKGSTFVVELPEQRVAALANPHR
ncbi:MAG TPA: ATP-binding protein [Planctomycetota bacterium]|nr:ATP-binding protein [Planctomycetota bacterium]